MGQDIKYIITTETIEVPINIIHFKEKNATIFPVLLTDSDFEDITVYAQKSSNTVYSFFDMVHYGPYTIEYPMKNLFMFIRNSKLKNLGMIAYVEMFDIPDNIGVPIAFINDQLVKISSRDFPEDEIHRLLNAEVTFSSIINHEDKYWSYKDAEIYYLENLKNIALE